MLVHLLIVISIDVLLPVAVQLSPEWVHRIATDGRPVADLAGEIIELAGWAGDTAN